MVLEANFENNDNQHWKPVVHPPGGQNEHWVPPPVQGWGIPGWCQRPPEHPRLEMYANVLGRVHGYIDGLVGDE